MKCPQCGKIDRVQRVASAVAMGSRTHDTSTRFRIVGWTSGVGVGRGGTSLFGGPTVATGAGETHGQSRSDLARHLAQPNRPRPFTARWSGAGWLLGLMAAAAGPLLVATGVIAALRLPPPHMSIWRGDPSSAGLVVLPAAVVGYHLTWERTFGRRQVLLWRASLTAWLNAWYCARCHVVFLPEEYAPVMCGAHLAQAQPAAALRATLVRLAPLLVQSREGSKT